MLYLLEEDATDQSTVRGIFGSLGLAMWTAQEECGSSLDWEDDGITWTAHTLGDSVFAITEWEPGVYDGREDRL